nr:unnamed protein product [Callosobruchus analis]
MISSCLFTSTEYASCVGVKQLDVLGFSLKFQVKLCHPAIVWKLTIVFADKYPELENLVKCEFYLKNFKGSFNLKFGRPQVDVCSECKRHGTRLKDPWVYAFQIHNIREYRSFLHLSLKSRPERI